MYSDHTEYATLVAAAEHNGYVIDNGTIKSPGKFEHEPVDALYWYDAYCNGMADDIDDDIVMFELGETECRMFGKLVGTMVELHESADGFVSVHYVEEA